MTRRKALLLLWLSFLLISGGTGGLLYDLYRQGEQARLQHGRNLLRAGCEAIRARYSEGIGALDVDAAPRAPGRDPHLDAMVKGALADYGGVEGGIWDQRRGFIGYSYPTYEGAAPKTDLPQAEMLEIGTVARAAAAARTLREHARIGQRETVLFAACPLPAPPDSAVAWTLTRVGVSGRGYTRLLTALGVMLVFVVVSGLWLTFTFSRWSARLARVELALASHTSVGSLAAIPATGDLELDRIVQAFNALAVRLVQARREAEALAARVARADRLAALGRLSAGLAHEIRNPLAAMRLKIENAQAAARSGEPLDFLLSQTARLEGLVRNLLAMTQPLDLHAERVVMSAWLAEHAQAVAPEAERRGVSLQIAGDPQGASFDAFHLGRALDNLLLNALQHAPRGGTVRATAVREGDWLRVRVEDDGPGVPSALRASLFEPFVTGRAEGTGLGLAIVREIVVAHGGGVRETAPARGACFEMELPWPAS